MRLYKVKKSKIDNKGFVNIKFISPQNYKTITKNGKK